MLIAAEMFNLSDDSFKRNEKRAERKQSESLTPSIVSSYPVTLIQDLLLK